MPFDGAEFGRMLIVEKIDRVTELLGREDRWCKGALRSPDGRRCLAGAMLEAEARTLLTPVLLQAIRETTGSRYRRIGSSMTRPRRRTSSCWRCSIALERTPFSAAPIRRRDAPG
jgi:hypothetical protein